MDISILHLINKLRYNNIKFVVNLQLLYVTVLTVSRIAKLCEIHLTSQTVAGVKLDTIDAFFVKSTRNINAIIYVHLTLDADKAFQACA